MAKETRLIEVARKYGITKEVLVYKANRNYQKNLEKMKLGDRAELFSMIGTQRPKISHDLAREVLMKLIDEKQVATYAQWLFSSLDRQGSSLSEHEIQDAYERCVNSSYDRQSCHDTNLSTVIDQLWNITNIVPDTAILSPHSKRIFGSCISELAKMRKYDFPSEIKLDDAELEEDKEVSIYTTRVKKLKRFIDLLQPERKEVQTWYGYLFERDLSGIRSYHSKAHKLIFSLTSIPPIKRTKSAISDLILRSLERRNVYCALELSEDTGVKIPGNKDKIQNYCREELIRYGELGKAKSLAEKTNTKLPDEYFEYILRHHFKFDLGRKKSKSDPKGWTRESVQTIQEEMAGSNNYITNPAFRK